MKVTAIVARPAPSSGGPTAAQSPREFHSVDEFADAVGKAAGISVPVIEGSLADAPEDGYILAYDIDLTQHPAIARRVVVVGANRSDVLQDLDLYSLVGAIESYRYFQWKRKPGEEDGGRGVFGLKEVAAQDGRRFGPFTMARYGRSPHYDLLSSERYSDLPSLLAGYLAAHAQLVAGEK